MDCGDLENWARSGQLDEHLGEPEVMAHLRQCGACEALYASHTQLGAALAAQSQDLPALDFDALRQELDSALAADQRDPRSFARDVSTRVRVAVALGLILATPLILALVAPRRDWATYPAARMWVVLGCLAVVAAWATREFSKPLTQVVEPRRRRTALAVTAALPLLFACLPVHEPSDAAPASPMAAAFGCLTMGVVYAVPTALWLFLSLRWPMTENIQLWLLAGLLGVAGNAALQVHCQHDDVAHLVVGHALLGLVWAGAFVVSHYRAGQRA